MIKLMTDSVTMLQSGATFSTLATKVLRDQFKVQPDGALGYSLGEMTMMFGAGVWSVADNNSELVGTSPLFTERLAGVQTVVREHWHLPPADPQDQMPIWGIFVLKTNAADVELAIAHEERVYLTHINTPKEVVIAGDPEACWRVIQKLACDFMPMPYNQVLHCELMQPEWPEFARLNTIPVSATPSVDFYYAADNASPALTSETIAQNIAAASYQRVDFPRLIQRAYDDGVRVFLELGPRAACTWWIQDILVDQPHLAAAMNRRSLDDHTMIVRLLAQLVAHRTPVDLSTLYVPLPDETDAPARSLVRTVKLTKPVIRDVILTAENRELFADIALKPVKMETAVSMALSASVAQPATQPIPQLEEKQPMTINETSTTAPVIKPILRQNVRNTEEPTQTSENLGARADKLSALPGMDFAF
ncbi:MAG: hypothetical protein M5U34_19275 [Chloroflexi bacterium]|nr:hypothetical protein [Chloroflexota bacterium]